MALLSEMLRNLRCEIGYGARVKVALVHELLTIKGGAERVLRVLVEMYPDAPIYTLLYDEKKLGDWFPKERVRIAKFPTPYSLLPTPYRYNHHLYLPWFPHAVESWSFDSCVSPHPTPLPFKGEREECFDLVISSSSAFVHGIITNGAPKHLCYVHSPARYLWDRTHDVLERAGSGVLGQLRRAYLGHVFHKLRTWDAESADRPDMLLAASKTVQRRIELYWRRESAVVYPPIDEFWLQQTTNKRATSNPFDELRAGKPTSNYFLIVSQLAPYKRLDLAIDACNQLRLPLKIAGGGPDRKRLERLAGPTVTFLGYVQEGHLPGLYQKATATIFPGDEDFGLVPLESQAMGTPVIAYREGGALETILEGKTGTFFDEPTAASLAEVLQHFDRSHFSAEACRTQAQKFSRQRFEQGIREAVESLLSGNKIPSPLGGG